MPRKPSEEPGGIAASDEPEGRPAPCNAKTSGRKRGVEPRGGKRKPASLRGRPFVILESRLPQSQRLRRDRRGPERGF